METKEFIIMSKEYPNKFLQHIGFTHQFGNRADAMIYTKSDVATQLAIKYGGVVIPAGANLPR